MQAMAHLLCHLKQALTSDYCFLTTSCLTSAILPIVFFSVVLPAHSRPRPLIQFRNHFSQTVGTPWTSDQPVARPLPKHRTTQAEQTHIHTQTHTHTHTKHPCLDWDSNPWFQRPSERLRPRGYCDRHQLIIASHILLNPSHPPSSFWFARDS
jgi:hypothetical protein